MSQHGVLARCEPHVAGEDELAAHAPGPASDLRDAGDRGLADSDERIHQDREARRPGGLEQAEAPRDIGQIKVAKVELRIRALEYDDAKALAGVHSSEQILEAFEHGGAHDVEGRVVEHNPPVTRCLLDDAQLRR